MIKDTILMTAGIAILGFVLLSSMNAGFVKGWTALDMFGTEEHEIWSENPDGTVFHMLFKDVWHENIMPVDLISANTFTKVLYAEVHPSLTNGSDGACEAFGQVMLHMLNQMPEGWAIYVTNEWVPSSKNPINLKWARVLAQGY